MELEKKMENTSTLAAPHNHREGGEGKVTILVYPYNLSSSSGLHAKKHGAQ